ncbi:hypothetical protein [Candidatus Magnetaquicoccus inordinatus]|uniref:hypothetical protein n=1 Tax=Candidatus Magnetaquicoccus inordinatus TaxID=2496818 RepID=UPI00102C4585|nr:hypothetical protein [Candidatus Magnetaquicoccus inordinatus]
MLNFSSKSDTRRIFLFGQLLFMLSIGVFIYLPLRSMYNDQKEFLNAIGNNVDNQQVLQVKDHMVAIMNVVQRHAANLQLTVNRLSATSVKRDSWQLELLTDFYTLVKYLNGIEMDGVMVQEVHIHPYDNQQKRPIHAVRLVISVSALQAKPEKGEFLSQLAQKGGVLSASIAQCAQKGTAGQQGEKGAQTPPNNKPTTECMPMVEELKNPFQPASKYGEEIDLSRVYTLTEIYAKNENNQAVTVAVIDNKPVKKGDTLRSRVGDDWKIMEISAINGVLLQENSGKRQAVIRVREDERYAPQNRR